MSADRFCASSTISSVGLVLLEALDQEAVQREQVLGLGVTGRLDPVLVEEHAEEVERLETRIEDEGRERLAVELREQRVQQRGLAGADLAGEQHEALARPRRRRPSVASPSRCTSPRIEERRIRRHLEGAPHQPVVLVVHRAARSARAGASGAAGRAERLVAARHQASSTKPGAPFTTSSPTRRRSARRRRSPRRARPSRTRRRWMRGAVRVQQQRRNAGQHRDAKRRLQLARGVERGIDALEQQRRRRRRARGPSIRPTSDDQRSIGRARLRRRERRLEHAELLALLAPLHVGRHAGLETLRCCTPDSSRTGACTRARARRAARPPAASSPDAPAPRRPAPCRRSTSLSAACDAQPRALRLGPRVLLREVLAPSRRRPRQRPSPRPGARARSSPRAPRSRPGACP